MQRSHQLRLRPRNPVDLGVQPAREPPHELGLDALRLAAVGEDHERVGGRDAHTEGATTHPVERAIGVSRELTSSDGEDGKHAGEPTPAAVHRPTA